MHHDRSTAPPSASCDHTIAAWKPRSTKSRLAGALAAVVTSSLVLGTVLAVFDSADSTGSPALASAARASGTAS